MKVLVVFFSTYGHVFKVAEAIAEEAGQMKSILKPILIVILATGIVSCATENKQSQTRSVRRQIVRAYGIEHFDQVRQLRYTFNVQLPDKRVRRSWIWEPQTDAVTFTGGPQNKTVKYFRKEINAASSKQLRTIDGWFINGNYWLLFPIHLAWDRQATVEDIGRRKLPMGPGSARCVVVRYPSAGGYTPGDVYELYVDENYRLIQWVYHRGGSKTPSRITTWEDYKRVGPLVLSLTHQGPEATFRVWFTNVAVMPSGSNQWIFAD